MRHQNECIYAVSKSYLHNSLQGQGRCYSFSVLLMRSCCGKVLPERKLFYTTSIQHWLAPTARSIPGDGAGFCTPKNPEAQVNVVQGCILSAALGGTGTSLPLLSAITTRSTRAGDQDELSFFFSLFFFPFFFLPPPRPRHVPRYWWGTWFFPHLPGEVNASSMALLPMQRKINSWKWYITRQKCLYENHP